MLAMLSTAILAATAPEGTAAPVGGRGSSTVANVISDVFSNISGNGYQTGAALVVTTIAIVAMLNIGVHRLVLAPVGIGAFWAGWLGWNTFTGQDNPLFPGDLSAIKLWDVAFTSDTGFLMVVIVGCVAALFLWRKGIAIPSRVMLLVGAVLGASFLYNLFEAVRYA
jgi:hypothetical protein